MPDDTTNNSLFDLGGTHGCQQCRAQQFLNVQNLSTRAHTWHKENGKAGHEGSAHQWNPVPQPPTQIYRSICSVLSYACNVYKKSVAHRKLVQGTRLLTEAKSARHFPDSVSDCVSWHGRNREKKVNTPKACSRRARSFQPA